MPGCVQAQDNCTMERGQLDRQQLHVASTHALERLPSGCPCSADK
jgi:hypothetical protein